MSSATDEQVRERKARVARFLLEGKSGEALAELKKVLELAPEDLPARKRLADLTAKGGRTADAVAEYQRLVGRYAMDGQLVPAIAICTDILRLDPAHRETQETLALLYARKAGAAAPAHEDLVVLPGEPEPDALSFLDRIELAPRTPLFSDLPRDIFVGLLESLSIRTCPDGAVIVREGDMADALFVVVQGTVEVVRGLGTPTPQVVDAMGESTFFGEMGLLAGVPRLASVVAKGDVVLLELTREMLTAVTQRFPAFEEVLQHFYKKRLLANLLRSSPLFADLTERALGALIDRFVLRSFPEGTVFLQEGQLSRGLYVLLRGRCAAVQLDRDGRERRFPDMAEGAVFGEISLLSGRPASATVRAEGPCLVLGLDVEGFRAHILANPQATNRLAQLGAERLARKGQVVQDEFVGWDVLN